MMYRFVAVALLACLLLAVGLRSWADLPRRDERAKLVASVIAAGIVGVSVAAAILALTV